MKTSVNFVLGLCMVVLSGLSAVIEIAHAADTAKIILKTASQQSYPKFYMDEQGGLTGLGIDIMQALEAQDPDIQFEYQNQFVPWNRIQKLLELGRLDIYFGLVKNPVRLEKYIFLATPLYQLNHVVAVRADDTVAVANFADIVQLGQDGIILTPRGSGTIKYMNSQAQGLIIDSGAEHIIGNLTKLTYNRGRFFYFHNLAIQSAIKDHNLSNKIKVLPAIFRDYYQWAAFSKKVPLDVRTKVEAALVALHNNGKLEQLFNAYISWQND